MSFKKEKEKRKASSLWKIIENTCREGFYRISEDSSNQLDEEKIFNLFLSEYPQKQTETGCVFQLPSGWFIIWETDGFLCDQNVCWNMSDSS